MFTITFKLCVAFVDEVLGLLVLSLFMFLNDDLYSILHTWGKVSMFARQKDTSNMARNTLHNSLLHVTGRETNKYVN